MNETDIEKLRDIMRKSIDKIKINREGDKNGMLA